MMGGCAAFVMFCGVMLSLSRGGWISLTAGVLVLMSLSSFIPNAAKPSFMQYRWGALGIGVIVLLGLSLAVLSLIDSQSRSQLDQRLEETVTEQKFSERASIWKDSLGIIRDFPIAGVGLGAWSEIFPKYRSAPWGLEYFRETHNDFIELACETGLVGFALLVWFFCAVGRQLWTVVRKLHGSIAPVYFALLAAMVGLAIHETVDFSLHIPANALVFALFLGLTLRIAASARSSSAPRVREDSPRVARYLPSSLLVGIGMASALGLIILALRQDKLPYPYDIRPNESLAAIRDFVVAHPANASAHVALVNSTNERMPLANTARELETAVWLEPSNPFIRDMYASVLYHTGRRTAALQHMTLSVYEAPARSNHFYLSDRSIGLLTPAQQEAVESGFERAVAASFSGAVDEFGSYYETLHKYSTAGDLYYRAAKVEPSEPKREAYLLKSGIDYSRAGQRALGKQLFLDARAANPVDPESYEDLATYIYGPAGDLAAASQTIEEGISVGGDPLHLYLALSFAAESQSNLPAAEDASAKAVAVRPADLEATMRLGHVLYMEAKYDLAAKEFERASKIDQSYPEAFYSLALAQEGGFDYSAAQQNYRRAILLEPSNRKFLIGYRQFQQKVNTSLTEIVR
jgi:tetratricopeptide (TPR) repeat protein